MSAATKDSIAFRLGRTLGAAVRFCLHDNNSLIRWVKRVIVISAVVLSLSYFWSAILGTLLSIGCIWLVASVFLKGNSGLVSAMLKDDTHRHGSDDIPVNQPFYGEHEHPDYKMYFKD